jgi:hypothetical protein
MEKSKLKRILKMKRFGLIKKQIVTLFDKDRSVITKHIGNIFSDGELEQKSNVQNLHIANSDKSVKFYNLDVIISVGYRVYTLFMVLLFFEFYITRL